MLKNDNSKEEPEFKSKADYDPEED